MRANGPYVFDFVGRRVLTASEAARWIALIIGASVKR